MPMRPHLPRHAIRLGQAGFTLVELMVAILIGFAVVGALLAAYMAAYRSTLHNDALSEVTEDATLALNAIRAQAAMAGYSAVTVDRTTQSMNGRGFSWLFGCSKQNFPGPPYIPLQVDSACTGTSNSDTLEVAYEARDATFAGGSSNAILNEAGNPLDCLGNPIPPTTDSTGTYYLADSKFYVSDGKLYCQGAGDVTKGAPLVDNVDHMTVLFGFSGTSKSNYDGVSAQIQHYAAAPSSGASTDAWKVDLASVTVCIEVHSTSVALESNGGATDPLANFVDCTGTLRQSPPDGRLHRSFSTTIVFQNKLL